jgi:hypothetical protein
MGARQTRLNRSRIKLYSYHEDSRIDQGQRVFFLPGFSGFSARSAVENHRFFGVNHHETLGFPAI